MWWPIHKSRRVPVWPRRAVGSSRPRGRERERERPSSPMSGHLVGVSYLSFSGSDVMPPKRFQEMELNRWMCRPEELKQVACGVFNRAVLEGCAGRGLNNTREILSRGLPSKIKRLENTSYAKPCRHAAAERHVVIDNAGMCFWPSAEGHIFAWPLSGLSTFADPPRMIQKSKELLIFGKELQQDLDSLHASCAWGVLRDGRPLGPKGLPGAPHYYTV